MVLTATTCALAQDAPGIAGLVPVDQGLEDVHPLAASLRVDTAVHQSTDDFVNVYEDPSNPGRYIRTSGAIHAVFPRSTYAVHEGRIFATVPPGTIYYIGAPPEGDTIGAGATAIRPVQNIHAINLRGPQAELERIRLERIEAARMKELRRSRRAAQLTMSDELYRRQRLREIALRDGG